MARPAAPILPGRPAVLAPDEARRRLVAWLGLARPHPRRGRRGMREVLDRLAAVQIDPIDRVGTNADLVFHARVDGVRRGDWGRLPDVFEHFARQRCLLPGRAFPFYRDGAGVAAARWWRQEERDARLPAELLDRVLAEVARRGPLAARDLGDHGRVAPIDWNGWRGTARAGSMALESLWLRCRVVVARRGPGMARLYDLPERALPGRAAAPGGDFGRFALPERARAAGLLPEADGPWWAGLRHLRGRGADRLVAAGVLARVRVTGSRRTFLCPPALLDGPVAEPDGRARILGPLDPLLWDRRLVRHLFDFDYAWEVYRPPARRRWGYYVCPVLHGGRLVGRLEARRTEDGRGVEVLARWGRLPGRPLRVALERLAAMQAPRG